MQVDSNPLSWPRLSKDISIDSSTQFEQSKFGVVYRGYSFFRDQTISIKILPKAHTSKEYIRTLEEVGKLSHQYIMGYYGHVEDQDNYYFCIEYCPYGTLEKIIQKKLTQKECLRFFRQIVEAMEYMHSYGQLHKDLKPENILIGPYQDIKICNFGLNDDENSGIWETGKYGTAIYGAPEVLLIQNSDQQYTEESDVWSAGLICYEMLTGHHFLQDVKDYDELKEEWLRIERGSRRIMLSESCHPLWSCFFHLMLAFRPQLRPSFNVLLHQLQLIYPKLYQDIQQQMPTLTSSLQDLRTYIDFTIAKYGILLEACQTFTAKDIRLRNEFKYLIMFCCMMRYRAFYRSFQERMKKKEIRIKEEVVFSQEVFKEGYCELIVMECLTIMKQKQQFYAHQVKQIIVPKILKVYSLRQDSQFILKESAAIVDLVIKTQREPELLQQESSYEDALHSILMVIQKKHGDVTQYYTRQQLEIYSLILIAMLISQQYPQHFYKEINVLADLTNKIEFLDKEALVENIKKLSNNIF